jgi:tetratricopeptide (TPR) repeat protein
MQKALQLAPDRADTYLSLALLQIRSNQPDAAEQNFKKALQLNAKSSTGLLAYGGFLQSRGRLPEAEQQYRNAIAADAKNTDARNALARLFIAQGRKPEAEAFLKQTKTDLPDNSAGYRMLGDYYFAIGDVDKAVDEYASLYRDHAADPLVKKNYIQLLILKNKLDEARKLNDEVLKANGNDSEALIYKGQILTRQGKPSEAVEALQSAIKSDPNSGVAHYHLGIAFDLTGNPTRAESEWRDAIRLRPDLTDAYRALAAAAARKNDMQGLAQNAEQIINTQPLSPDGFLLRAAAETNRKQFPQAEQDIQKAIQLAPQSPAGYVQLGNLRQSQSKYSDAQKAFQQALDKDPASSDALQGLMNVFLSQKQTDQAISVANAQIAKVPNSSAFHDLLGSALFTKKDLQGAEAELKKAIQLDRNNSDALVKLGQVQVAMGAIDQAIATWEQSIKDNPRDANFYVLVGEAYQTKGDAAKARQMFQKALDLQPENPLASNNLAYVMLEEGGNIDVALSMAQTARRAMPDSPNTADTLGWAYYQKGAYSTAIGLFKEAMKKRPDDATLNYHLGMAYLKSDQQALAKQHLERVLKINPNYAKGDDVKKALAQLRG